MALRWCAAGMLEAGRQFRRVNGHMHLPELRAALNACFAENVSAACDDREQKAADDQRGRHRYYQRIWNLGFAAADLTAATTGTEAPGAGPVIGVEAGQADTACGREEAP